MTIANAITTARTLYPDYQTGKLSAKEITGQRPVMEAQLLAVLHNPPLTGWLADAQRFTNRIKRHWVE